MHDPAAFFPYSQGMKPLFLVLVLLCAVSALAEDPTASAPLAPKATRHGGKVVGRVGHEKHLKVRNDISGRCIVMESPMNPISGPCVSVPLELKNAKGISMGISRTSAEGMFSFAVEDEGPYTLAPSSSFYVVVSPKTELEKGQRIDFRIRQKN